MQLDRTSCGPWSGAMVPKGGEAEAEETIKHRKGDQNNRRRKKAKRSDAERTQTDRSEDRAMSVGAEHRPSEMARRAYPEDQAAGPAAFVPNHPAGNGRAVHGDAEPGPDRAGGEIMSGPARARPGERGTGTHRSRSPRTEQRRQCGAPPWCRRSTTRPARVTGMQPQQVELGHSLSLFFLLFFSGAPAASARSLPADRAATSDL